MGSSVRFKGIEREVQLRLPLPVRAYLASDAAAFTLRMPDDQEDIFQAACEAIETVLSGIDILPVLPSEAVEILTTLPRERLKWTKDMRLLSAGSKIVKMRGRAKAVTFYVHDVDVDDLSAEELIAMAAHHGYARSERSIGHTCTRCAGSSGKLRSRSSAPRHHPPQTLCTAICEATGAFYMFNVIPFPGRLSVPPVPEPADIESVCSAVGIEILGPIFDSPSWIRIRLTPKSGNVK
jgi:hypothetical protein